MCEGVCACVCVIACVCVHVFGCVFVCMHMCGCGCVRVRAYVFNIFRPVNLCLCLCGVPLDSSPISDFLLLSVSSDESRGTSFYLELFSF